MGERREEREGEEWGEKRGIRGEGREERKGERRGREEKYIGFK